MKSWAFRLLTQVRELLDTTPPAAGTGGPGRNAASLEAVGRKRPIHGPTGLRGYVSYRY